MKAFGVVIPLRAASSRLPGKPLRDVGGRTALERVVSQAARSRRARRIVVATTTDETDDRLAEVATTLGLDVFRGSTGDVLHRLTAAALQFGFEGVVEVDGDDLLCSWEYMDLGIDILCAERADYVRFTGLPLGATPNVLAVDAMAKAVREKDYADTATGIFRPLTESGRFNVLGVPARDPRHLHATARLTLDYPQDLAFFTACYGELDAMGNWTFADLVALLHRRPDLVALNQGLEAEYRAHFQANLARARPGKAMP